MSGCVYGYARVSSTSQKLDRQHDALLNFPVPREHIYSDKASGSDFERPEFRRLLKRLHAGDVLVIESVDRLGRNYREVLDEWRRITLVKQVSIVVLDMPLLDTRRNCGSLTGTFIADLVLQILSYVAELERENIKRRQAEGIASAHLRGVRFGRPEIDIPNDYLRVASSFKNREITRKEAAETLGVSVSTFDRWRKRVDSQGSLMSQKLS